MLGNIKFICELGKQQLLPKNILHDCIKQLLSKKKTQSLKDKLQDLECLCEIMRNIGDLLDNEGARSYMNQYFDRIEFYSKNMELTSRIRFMLLDVIDLRKNNVSCFLKFKLSSKTFNLTLVGTATKGIDFIF